MAACRPPPDDDGYGEYLRRTGAAGSLDATSVAVLTPPAGLSLQPMRDAAGDALRLALPEPEAGLAAGILVGLRERVDRTLAADFARPGRATSSRSPAGTSRSCAGLVGRCARAAAAHRRRSSSRHDPRLRAGRRGVAVGRAGGGDGGRRAPRPRVGTGRSGTGGARAGRVPMLARRAGDDRRRRASASRWPRPPACSPGRTPLGRWIGGLRGRAPAGLARGGPRASRSRHRRRRCRTCC